VEEDEETIGGAHVAVRAECREVDAEGGPRSQVEEAATRPCVGGDREDDPATGTKAAVQVDLGAMRVIGEVAPRLAHCSEAQVLGDVEGEQPTGDILDEVRK
jgi:hypothetical protein